MSSLTTYKNLSVVTPDPTGPGGLAINDNFKVIADSLADGLNFLGAWNGSTTYNTNDIVTNDDIYYVATSPNTDEEPPGANWSPIASGYLPLSGGTLTGTLTIAGGEGSGEINNGGYNEDDYTTGLLNFVCSQGVTTNGGAWSGGNMLDDGSGNMAISGQIQFTQYDVEPQLVFLSGAAIMDDMTGGIEFQGSKIATANNTLDDGSGNMTVSSLAITDAPFSIISGSGQMIITNTDSGGGAALTFTDLGGGYTTSIVTGGGAGYNTLDDGSGNMIVASRLTATYFSGNGASLTNLDAANVSGTLPAITIGGNLTLSTHNIITDTSTGTKIGTATSQKLGFWNATPVAQQTTSGSASTIIANSGTAVNQATTYDGYTIQQVVKALRTLGILA